MSIASGTGARHKRCLHMIAGVFRSHDRRLLEIVCLLSSVDRSAHLLADWATKDLSRSTSKNRFNIFG